MTRQDLMNQIVNDLRVSREKIIYFLMSASGASIGFATTQMNDLLPDQYNRFLYIGIVLWACSFICGLRAIRITHGTMLANAKVLEMKNDTHPKILDNAGFDKMVEDDFATKGKKFGFWCNSQALLLLFGAFCYIVWQILKCSDCELTLSILNML
ncbi:MAG: hypothetical protein JKX71_02675 [Amylibacter sp.]|nr:hypothetical protein [Amylibacter sp.]